MTEDLFKKHLNNFIAKHGITSDLTCRHNKLECEVSELDEAILDGDKAEIIKEAADVAIIAFHIMCICGVTSPLHTMFLKLEEVAVRPKYQQRAKRILEQIKDPK